MIERENLRGLVVAGGRSKRMGRPKALLEYRDGLPQWKHAAMLLATRCSEVFVSLSAQSIIEVEPPFKTLFDTETDQGPIHAWARASEIAPHCYWLCINCDLPRADIEMIDSLLSSKSDHLARAFMNPETQFDDPQSVLLSPDALTRLDDAYRWGMRTPRRFIAEFPVHTLEPQRSEWLEGANTPEDFIRIRDSI